ncbi:MAG TPA: response regulator, partial [Candidatus Angelobacter sp.]|nr:response regulator [Candidatus Angelobacter sp.]
MSFRILFADDSMTAQNMGKKILTDAGYEVVAVSNGAAAVKKIAEHKPDIIILDIYMPGYSGLEVCDKVRASHDTLKTPVLLTVGKMEPYRPEDANRVRADGVIIKPFEASDLLAVIKKLEERVTPKTVAMAQETVLLERQPEYAEFEPPMPEGQMHVDSHQNTVQGTVDVPDNMATTAAFSDLLGMDPAYALDPPSSSAAVMSSPEPVVESPVAFTEPAVSEEKTVTVLQPEPVVESLPVEPARAAGNSFGIHDTQPIPVYREPSSASPAIEVESEPKQVVESSPVTSTSPGEIPPFVDPGLVIDAVSFEPAPATVETETTFNHTGIETSAAPPVEVEAPKTAVEDVAAPKQESSVVEDDFEARVAAAMSMYDEPVQEKVEPELPSPIQSSPEAHQVEPARQPQIEAWHSEPPASFEYSPPIVSPDTQEAVRNAEPPQSVVVQEPVREAAPMASAQFEQQVREAAPEVVAQSEPPAAEPQHVPQPIVHPGPILVSTEATMMIPVYLD